MPGELLMPGIWFSQEAGRLHGCVPWGAEEQPATSRPEAISKRPRRRWESRFIEG